MDQSLSKADMFLALGPAERGRRLASLTDEACEALLYDWDFWRRPNQIMPEGDWITWLLKAGRGFGKTRVGAETVREWIKDFPIVNLVGPTARDVRNIMIEGPSGILAVCPRGERPNYQPSKARLVWPNGAVSLLFSADEPDRLRGPQCYKAWADEIVAWQYLEEAWDQLMFGLRLGTDPQVVVTTTPKPVKVIRELVKDPNCKVTGGSTYENKRNLATAFLKRVVTKYEGTRLGRQELNAELLDDNPNALFQRKLIDDARLKHDQVPPLVRIVIPVDPAVTANEDSDDTGIVPVGMDQQDPPHFYVLEDATLHESPTGWAKKTCEMYYKWKADRVVGEVNNGGDLVEAVLRNEDPNLSYKAVHATRGKILRAEPIAALYEQGRVHHVGFFGALEDQMCDFDPQTVEKSPDRLDALVWGLTELSGVVEEETLVTHEEQIHISGELDAVDYGMSAW